MQQACRSVLKNLNTFACYTVKDVTINVIIQSRPVIIKFNLASYSVLSLMIIKWLIISESEKLSNHILRDSETIILIKN